MALSLGRRGRVDAGRCQPCGRKEELCSRAWHSDQGSTSFPDLLTAPMFAALPSLLLTTWKLLCSLALYPGVLKGAGTSCMPEVLQGVLGLGAPPHFCVPETKVPGTHCPAPDRGTHKGRRPPVHPKHLVSSQWNSWAWPLHAQIPFCPAALSSYLWQDCHRRGLPDAT